MSNITRHVLLASAFLLALGGTADAQRAKPAAKAKDGRSARAAVIKNYKAKGRSTNVRVTKTGMSKSGKSMQVLVHSKGSGKVRAMNVRKGSAYETPTNATTQAEARGAANQKLRRQNGTYSGVNSSGLSRSGKSYKFNSATDRAPKTGDRAYVSVKSGKARKNVRGK